jgi:hypothetical protein
LYHYRQKKNQRTGKKQKRLKRKSQLKTLNQALLKAESLRLCLTLTLRKGQKKFRPSKLKRVKVLLLEAILKDTLTEI